MFIAKIIAYEIWGNDEEGFEVNNLFEVAKVKLNGDFRKLTDRQIMKRLNGKRGYNRWSPYNSSNPTHINLDMRVFEIDSNSGDNMIELVEKKNGRPVGRIELSDMEA